MTDRSLPVSGAVTFEELKKTNEHGAEFGAPVSCSRCWGMANGGVLKMQSIEL